MNIGRWTIDWVTDGTWWLDGGMMFGRVPRVLWGAVAPPDHLNRVRLTCRPLVLRSDDACVLVDSGLGRALSPKMLEQLSVDPAWELLPGLKSLGITPDKVNYVILSHLHFDHVGGCVRRDDAGRLVPTFPNARHLVQRGEWKDAHTDNVLLRRSYVADTFLPLDREGLVEQLDGPGEVLPGVRVEVTGGHVAHHQMISVSDGTRTLAYPADLMPFASHINPAWVLALDAYPLDSAAQRIVFLERAEAEDWLVVLNHDPARATGKVAREEGGRYVWTDG